MQFSDPNMEFTGVCNRKVNHKCKVNCKPGYRLEGNNHMECLETMSWSPQPICNQRCLKISSPIIIEPGDTCTREINSTCKVTCQDATQWLQSHSIICNSQLEWDPSNTCVDRPITCTLDGGPNMKLQWPCEPFDTCKVICDKPMYYVPMTTKNEADCTENGAVLVDNFRCKKVKWETCGNIAEKIGSHLMLPGAEDSLQPFTTAVVACKDPNKILKGKAFVMCQFDGTLTTSPQCLSECNKDDLAVPGNRKVSSSCIRLKVLAGEYCRIDCLGDTTADNSIMAKCGSDGSWEDVPNCVTLLGNSVDCDNTELSGDFQVEDTPSSYKEVECFNPRYTLVGPKFIQCSYTGNWSPQPKCLMDSHYVKCFTPPIPDNAEIENESDCPRRFVYFEMATCKLKLNCITETIYRTLYCMSDGQWTKAYCDSPY